MKKHLMLLWHMHQPFYKDLAEGFYAMPWVRLHALKDYFGMVAVLRDFPSVHVTFNLVPSLIAQIEDYASGQAREESYDFAFKPAEQLTSAEREAFAISAFMVNRENLLDRYPRFRELLNRSHLTKGSAPGARRFSNEDIRDLQVLSQIAWFDEIYLAGDVEVQYLMSKGRSFSEADKSLIYNKEQEIFKVILKEYKEAAARGQIEISTSPYYHPILPLLCDTDVASESHPGARLPRHRFRHPEDARDQLRCAVALHERVFGRRPVGLWPSEGSVSDEVLKLAAAEGFTWAATDEGVLGRTLTVGFHRQPDGTVWNGTELYRPHRFAYGEQQIDVFFRDHELSDLIGFVYSRMEAQHAAADLHQRIRGVARSTGDRPAVVSVILDGENAWEFFRGGGREFLKAFYGRVAGDPELQAVTASEARALFAQPAATLKHIVPGSWINANFDVWIGADEDNRAWDMLSMARDFFAGQSRSPDVSPEKLSTAKHELWIAEGSDWNWWYGPEHSTDNDEEFDRLYRTHLSNVYRLLGASAPDELAVPIKRIAARARTTLPSGLITPTIDGRVSSYFEWLGAGIYVPDPSGGSMHGAARFLEALYFGYDRTDLFVRLDFSSAFLNEQEDFEIRVNCRDQAELHAEAKVSHLKLAALRYRAGDGDAEILAAQGGGLFARPADQAAGEVNAAFSKIFELRVPLTLLGTKMGGSVQLQISLWIDQLPVQVIPQDAPLSVLLAETFEG